jgi:hypothetical protein
VERLSVGYGCRAAHIGTLRTIHAAASGLKPISINSSSRSSTGSGSSVIELSASFHRDCRLTGCGGTPLCESQDLTCQTASDQIAFCMRAAEFRACHSGMVALSAWARWAVQPHSRVAVRRRHRA